MRKGKLIKRAGRGGNKTSGKREAGLTLIEVILASAITGGVILATISMYVFQEVQMKAISSRVDLSRDGYMTMLVMRDTVRFLSKSEYFDPGGQLFYQSGNQVKRRDASADRMIVFRVQPGGFTVTPNADTSYINVELHLIDSYDQEAHFSTIIRLRPS